MRTAERWIDVRLHEHVRALAGPDGLAVADAEVIGRRWQEPDGGLATVGRSDLHAAIDTTGRTSDRRGDFDTVYGDWQTLREQAAPTDPPVEDESTSSRGSAPRLDLEVLAALRLAADRPAGLLEPEHAGAAMTLLTAEGDVLESLVRLADQLRADVVGEEITYVVNRNINFSNVCYVGCRFCAFAQRERDADAYRLSTAEVADRAAEAALAGATEVCMQGGIDPKLPGDLLRRCRPAIKARVPAMHVHAFSPMEIVSAAAKAGVSVAEWLTELKAAGLDSIPGTAAEILDDDVRWVLTKGKLPAQTWIDVVTTAHRLGIPSSSTMMYGHVDHPGHWLGHLRVLARLQDDTGGFTEFVPLPFVHHNAPIYLAGVARPGRPHATTVRCTRLRVSRCTDGSTTCSARGSSWATREPPSCCAAASTTSAAPSWRKRSPGWRAPSTVPPAPTPTWSDSPPWPVARRGNAPRRTAACRPSTPSRRAPDSQSGAGRSTRAASRAPWRPAVP